MIFNKLFNIIGWINWPYIGRMIYENFLTRKIIGWLLIAFTYFCLLKFTYLIAIDDLRPELLFYMIGTFFLPIFLNAKHKKQTNEDLF